MTASPKVADAGAEDELHRSLLSRRYALVNQYLKLFLEYDQVKRELSELYRNIGNLDSVLADVGVKVDAVRPIESAGEQTKATPVQTTTRTRATSSSRPKPKTQPDRNQKYQNISLRAAVSEVMADGDRWGSDQILRAIFVTTGARRKEKEAALASIRTALSKATQDGLVERLEPGAYRIGYKQK
jgi:hypothetical protein